ncbi:MAG TPA: protein translocase subunit SecD [Nocardioides sp.]|uniref:protein translocase subunit SecD n=1 Tax=Nocardioides sp. TaxID=35761 RepID=UPI002ED842ED
MAAKAYRPGRTLVVFFLALAIAYGLVALAGTWKPALGLDLEGGTRITLIAKGDPSAENMREARGIIDQRVNGSGVTEAEVTTQGDNIIVVEIPGPSRRDLVDTVKRQAQLRFRLVACDSTTGGCGGAAPAGGLDQGLTGGTPAPADPAAPAAPRAPLGYLKAGEATPSATATPTAVPTTAPTAGSAATATPTPSPSPTQGGDNAGKARFDDAVAFMNNPPAEWITKYNELTCPVDPQTLVDDPAQPLVTCSPDGSAKYLLTPAIIEGRNVTDAAAGIPQNDVQYVVSLSFDGPGGDVFADATGTIAGTNQQFAIVLDGQVISAPTAETRIVGDAQISGDFTQAEAESLATSLKYGALPVAFEKDVSAEVIGPTLAGDQLSAGLTAGAFGLGLVMLYCLLYYRGLGLVVLASLVVAAAWTYAMVLLLSETANFTLTLPGIAGLIIAVGVTADSFIIFFERIRDEMRDGKSMRVAVESGWVRAKVTRLAANVVSLLSAAVLYIFATGVVKGFGFALGLSTLIDLAVLFWFTKPAVSYLARYKFFNGGGKLSGLSEETLGMDAPAGTPATVGGKA